MAVPPLISRYPLCAGLLAVTVWGCGGQSTPSRSESAGQARSELPAEIAPESSAAAVPPKPLPRLTTFPRFQEVAEELGIRFTYDNGAQGQALMVEATGGGAGWLDYDGDGRLDLYCCQGGNPATESPDNEPSDQIYRQVIPGRFVCETQHAAINERGYSQGIAVADFDDDGFDDVYVTNVGPDTLLHNQGDGTFLDVTGIAGVSDSLWSTSAAWADLDGDGNLDLYVCTYVDYDPHHPIMCHSQTGRPGTCHPKHLKAVPDECYFSRGDGTFSAEALSRGLFGDDGKGLGVVIADLNNDGLPDIYVANDTTPNFLFVNQGGGRFVESANFLGCAVSREGLMQASMGVALGDFDHNGWLDVYVTNFTREANTLYKNLGAVGFQDVTGLVGLYTPTLTKLGFGTVMTDFNQDGHEDIFITNGHVDDWRERGDDFEMEPLLFSYEGPRFVDCSAQAGDFFRRRLIGRGLALGDFDGDGDWDLAVVHHNSPTAILRNDSQRGNWLKVRCIAANNRRGLGTRVVLRQGAKVLTQELAGGVSYCSAHEPALIFGLGEDSSDVDLDIRWPNGARQTVRAQKVNCETLVRQSADPGDPARGDPPRESASARDGLRG